MKKSNTILLSISCIIAIILAFIFEYQFIINMTVWIIFISLLNMLLESIIYGYENLKPKKKNKIEDISVTHNIKKYTKIIIKYPYEKFNEENLNNMITAHDYVKELNKKDRKKFIEEFDEIAGEIMMTKLKEFYNFVAKVIIHGGNPIEEYKAIQNSNTVTKKEARIALATIVENFGVDIAYFGTELKEAEEKLIAFIEKE